MKRNKLTYIWVTGIFTILIIILYLVVEYKVKYEEGTFYKYLYFYKCNNDLCSTINENDIVDKSKIYSVYKYNYNDNTPTYTYINNNYIVINDNNNMYYYDYIKGEIISNYQSYELVLDNLIIKNNDKYGIINIDNIIVEDMIYDSITYSDNLYKLSIDDNVKYLYIGNEYTIVIENNKISTFDKNNTLLTNVEIDTFTNVSIKDLDSYIEINIDNNKYKYDFIGYNLTKE